MPANQNNNDDLDRWLNQRVTPLPPPDGTFDLIKRRARNRRMRKLAVTVTAAAAAVAAIVTIPRVTLLHITNPDKGVAVGNSTTPPGYNKYSSQQPMGKGTPESSASPGSSGSSTSPPPVPPNFRPYSVTFIGPHTGWVLGQAGTPGHCATEYCTSIARTDDAGTNWYGVPAPITGMPSGANGVSQIRFLNDQDGWVYGPQLWATHDGGRTWTEIPTDGKRVVALETAGSGAYALFANCTGTGPDFAASCTSFTLMSARSGSDTWSPVGPQTTNVQGNPQDAQIALTSIRGYLLAPDGSVLTGALGMTWNKVGTAPCAPSGHLFGTITSVTSMLVCPGDHTVYTSTDGGGLWQKVSSYPANLTATGAAVSPVGGYVLATTNGLYYLRGSTWGLATVDGAVSPDGYSYIGMTTDTQGIALSGPGSTGYLWVTENGGQTWQARPING
jgi:photosystem II stability/assembly factor-like uncharacterized protein